MLLIIFNHYDFQSKIIAAHFTANISDSESILLANCNCELVRRVMSIFIFCRIVY